MSSQQEPLIFTKAVHIRIIDFNPLPAQAHLDAFCKLFHNEFLIDELPGWELDEFVIQFETQDDLVKIEVWANDSYGMSFFII